MKILIFYVKNMLILNTWKCTPEITLMTQSHLFRFLNTPLYITAQCTYSQAKPSTFWVSTCQIRPRLLCNHWNAPEQHRPTSVTAGHSCRDHKSVDQFELH